MPCIIILMKHLYERRLLIDDYIHVAATLLKLDLDTQYPVEKI